MAEETIFKWAAEMLDLSVHVHPLNDWIDHRIEDSADCNCPCRPRVEWADENGHPFAMPLVTHHAIDGRD
jgi:hypothetical protein